MSKKSFDFRYMSRNSFYNSERIQVMCIQVGVVFGKKISLGGGYNWLQSNIFNSGILPDFSGALILQNNKLDFRYLSYYIDFVFYKSKRWRLSSEVEIGAGVSKFQFLKNGEKNTKIGNLFTLYNPAININYKIFKWLGLNATVGYRFMLVNDKNLGKLMNSPLLSVGGGISWDELVLAIFPNSSKVGCLLGTSSW
jgi:hypothetical protein